MKVKLPRTLYHATSASLLFTILEEGLKVGFSRFGPHSQHGISTSTDLNALTGGDFGNLILALDTSKMGKGFDFIPVDYWGDGRESEIRVVSSMETRTVIPPKAITKIIRISPKLPAYEVKEITATGIPLESIWKGKMFKYGKRSNPASNQVKLPASVIKGLKIGLQLERKGLGGRGLVDETIQMARTGVRTGKWDEWKIVKASNWFARHVADRRRMKNPQLWDKAPRYSPAYVAWALWGDDGKGAGKKWIDKKAKELRARGVKPSPRKNPAVSPKTPYLFDLDPHELVFTESRRSKKLSRVRDVDTSLPIVVTKIRGKYHILDGHHRTIRAEQENRLVRAVVIPPSSYRSFKKAGIHQADMFRAFARELIEQRKASPRKNPSKNYSSLPLLKGSDGQPLRLYKGTSYTGVLTPDARSVDDMISHEYGIYLTPRRGYAQTWARATGGRLREFTARARNPLVVEGKYEISPRDLTKQDINRLLRQGHDAIVVTDSNIDRASEVILFDSDQIIESPRHNPPRTQPYKYGVPAKYLKGLPDKVARARAKEIIMRREAGVKTSKPLPGDKIAQSKGMKGSKWTRMYKQKYGANAGKNRAAIARETGISPSIINEVYKRGVGASRTSGHRPGATDSSWALARTHAFVMKVLHGKGSINQDPDLARKVKAARRNPGRRKRKMSVQFYDIKNRKKVSISDNEISKRPIRTKNGTRYQLVGNTNDGRQVFRFISKDDYQSADYPVIR